MIRPGLTVVIDRTRAVADQIAELVGTRVLVGFPEGGRARAGKGQMNNATLAYIHDRGSPAANIPARPFMEPGVQRVSKTITEWMARGAREALSGKPTLGAYMTGAGLSAESGIKGCIAAGIPPPLKASTVARRRKRSADSAYRRKASTAAHTTPLIDTGQLLRAVTHVIDRGGKAR